MAACGHEPQNTSMLQKLMNAGCAVADKDDKGWNCLFLGVLMSCRPQASDEFERLQYLLSIFADIHARDAEGRTIFDRVDLIQEVYQGSYKRDLWYCALDRAGIDVSLHLVRHPRVPSYKVGKYDEYTPEHYHALKHLQSWDKSNFRSQMDRLLQEIPLDEDEALEMERLRRERLERDFDDESDMEYLSEDDDRLEGNDYLENDDRLQSENQSETNDQSQRDGRPGNDDDWESYDKSEPDIT